jgi:hypothetical protein
MSAPEPVSEEIIAWRGWKMKRDDANRWVLLSITWNAVWEGPTFIADEIPARDSQHGVYARKSRETLGEYAGVCCGEVALSGVVVEGENGYRAERATIRSLIIFGWPAPDVRPLEVMTELEERYQCEVSWECSEIATHHQNGMIINGMHLPAGNHSFVNCYFDASPKMKQPPPNGLGQLGRIGSLGGLGLGQPLSSASTFISNNTQWP